jgi:hypothetical protein
VSVLLILLLYPKSGHHHNLERFGGGRVQ